jgi:nitrate reductase (cytochrome), electron transfer subunit
MNQRIATLALCLTALTGWGVAQGIDLVSERGTAIEAPSPEPQKRKVEVVQGGFDRSWETQPPMIPHDIEKYEISLRQNGCLKCHSEATAEKEKTKPTPQSHFLDRDGNKMDHLSTRRYFCTQCHAPQLSGAPLVENTFEGLR